MITTWITIHDIHTTNILITTKQNAMKQITSTLARLLVMLTVLIFGAAVEPVNAQDQSLAEGYYYINTTVSDYSGQGMYYDANNTSWRNHQGVHNYGTKVTPEDLPYVYRFVKSDDGIHYTVQNYVSKLWWNRDSSHNEGAGFGFGENAAKFTVTPSGSGYVMCYDEDDKPSTGNCVHAQSDGFVGLWGDNTNIYAHKVWDLVPVDTASLFHPAEIVDVDKMLDDGYYFITFSAYDDPTVCMVPTNNGDDAGTWMLSAYPRDANDYDDSYIWHITCNKSDTTYTIKNCGSQDLTYIENVTKGDKESPVILMTGTNPAKFKIRFKSDGFGYLFSTDNDYNYAINTTSGSICTLKAQNTNSAVTFVPVPADRVTNAIKLGEAISDANGQQFTVGTEPGQVSQEDYDALSTVMEEATVAWEKDEDHTDIINKLEDATKTLISKKVPISDGYYYLINRYDATHYLKPVFKGGAWYLGHEEVADPTLDPSIVWHITGAADGGYVMKNCGLQDSTYFRPLASGYSWGYVSMTGTSVSKQSFKNEYSNIYKIYTEGNNNFFNGDWGSGFNGGLITTNNDNHPLDGSWTLVKVADDAIPFMTALNEAITDAKGTVKDMQVGMNPGDKKGDTTAIMKVIREAEAMYAAGSASDDEVKAEIAKLKTASDEFLAQDHSEVGIEDGYYYIITPQTAFQPKDPTQPSMARDKIAMRSDNTGYMKWQEIERTDPRYVFHITPLGDGTYSVQSMLYGTYIGKYSTNGITTDAKQTTPQTFTFASKSSEYTYYYMSNTTDGVNYNLSTYHSETSGAIGTGSDINTWRLERITNQTLIDSLATASQQQRRTEEMRNALAEAEPAYKGVFRWNADTDNPLITVTDEDDPINKGQIWGTQEPSAAGAGGYSAYKSLIDGDLNTCFQSTWTASVLPSGLQQMQFDLRNHPVQNFQFYFGLRANNWGYRECWSNVDLYATNDETLGKQETFDASQWTHIGNYTDMPSYIRPKDYSHDGGNRYFNYNIMGMDQPYRFLRFTINSTIEPQANTMYTIGETQIYELTQDEENSPYNYVDGLKALVDELSGLIETGKQHVADNTVTADELARIKELTSQVLALTPNTDDLEQRISYISDYIAKFSDADELGDVPSDELDAINNAIEEAQGYDHDKPQPADLNQRLDNLNKAFDAYLAAQKLPQPNVWYYIVNTDKSRLGWSGHDEGGTGGSIWDSFVGGTVIMAPHTNATRQADTWNGTTAIYWGGYNHATATRADSVEADPYSMWRLVKIEGNNTPNVYALQNRATGYFMGVSANHNGRIGLTTDTVPYLFSLLKSGQVSIVCQDKSNNTKAPLHASGDGYLCTWEATTDSPSSWNLEPVAEDLGAGELTIRNNNVMILTLPYAYTENEADLNADFGIKTYAVKGISEDGSKIELSEKKSFQAGEPMVVIAGDPAQYAASTDSIRMCVPLANSFDFTVKDANGLVGTLDYTQVTAGVGIPFGGKVINALDSYTLDDNHVYTGNGTDAWIIGQRGYFDSGRIVNNDQLTTNATIDVAGVINAINKAKAEAANGKVNVYSIDGVLLKKGVKAADAKAGLSRGTYIIGKKKVLIK